MEPHSTGQIGGTPMTPSGVSAMGVANDHLPEPPVSVRTEPFRDFYHAHVEFVWRGARRLGVDDAAVDDVVQHVFLVAYRRFPEFRLEDLPTGRGSVKAWVFAILVRVVREYRRTTRRKSPHVNLPHTDPETLADSRHLGPHEALAKVEAARLVQRLLEELDDDKREVFVLAELEQLTAVEIADALGVNASTVSSRLRAARRDFERAAERYRRRDTWRLG
jgi:RNA polymerase sigma-70 factor (ECF subfamily)